MAEGITTSLFEDLYETALRAGATGGKISGAGGGGFMTLCIEPEKKNQVVDVLNKYGGNYETIQFTYEGAVSWVL